MKMIMIEYILHNEGIIRVSFFIGVFILFAILESIFPRRNRNSSRLSRWIPNISIIMISTALIRGLNLIAPPTFALLIQNKGWGLLNQFALPSVLSIFITVIILDLVIYWQHRLMHRVNILWKLHHVHHTDLDLDVSSGNRFHPIEILISIFIKLLAIAAIGPLPVAVIIFEVILNAMAQFNHSNLKLPNLLDRFLRFIFVTPDFHIVHHSIKVKEQDSNFGFNLSLWDRIFGTYRPEPEKGCVDIEIGVKEIREQKDLSIFKILLLPFGVLKKNK